MDEALIEAFKKAAIELAAKAGKLLADDAFDELRVRAERRAAARRRGEPVPDLFTEEEHRILEAVGIGGAAGLATTGLFMLGPLGALALGTLAAGSIGRAYWQRGAPQAA